MGDMGETFKAYRDHKKQIKIKEESKRLKYALTQLCKYKTDHDLESITIYLPSGLVKFWPYTGWFQGKVPYGKVKGRGIKLLLKSLEKING